MIGVWFGKLADALDKEAAVFHADAKQYGAAFREARDHQYLAARVIEAIARALRKVATS